MEKSVTQNNKPVDYSHKKVQKLRLFDDAFMEKVFRNNTGAVELVVRTIIGKNDIVVKKYHLQYGIVNFLGHSITLDILAEDAKGNIYDIEIQRANEGASPKRVRYYSSLIDADYLKKSESYESLPRKYVIFITENDFFRMGKPLYEFAMTSQDEKHFPLKDEQHVIYVNGKDSSNTDLGRLMHDFRETNPDKMYYKELRDKAKYYKTNKKGEAGMKSVIDEVYEDGEKAGRAEGKTSSIRDVVKYLKKTATKTVAIEQLMGMFDLSREDATKYYMAA